MCVNNTLNVWRSLLPPHRCGICKQVIDNTLIICNLCREILPWETDKYQDATDFTRTLPARTRTYFVSLFKYRTPIRQMLIKLKFGGQTGYARLFGQLLALKLGQSFEHLALPEPECLLPVTLHPARLRRRGFNQALEIAKPISRILSIPLAKNLCLRKKNTRPQSELKPAVRKTNINNAFVAGSNGTGIPASVAIIDDVITTGATVNEIANILRQTGVKHIQVWCIARAILQR